VLRCPVWKYNLISYRGILDRALVLDAMRMFDNVQTLSLGMDMLIIGLAPLIALGLERYCQEGHEHG
jgi:hypothetical protein